MQFEAEYTAGQWRKISEFNLSYMNTMHDFGNRADQIANHFIISRNTMCRLIVFNLQYDEKSEQRAFVRFR